VASQLTHGATERDLVFSGLEDTMMQAMDETLATAWKLDCTYRFISICSRVHVLSVSEIGPPQDGLLCQCHHQDERHL